MSDKNISIEATISPFLYDRLLTAVLNRRDSNFDKEIERAIAFYLAEGTPRQGHEAVLKTMGVGNEPR